MKQALEQPPIRATDLWQHQLEAYHFAFGRNATMIAAWMGSGKSRITVDLLRNWDCGPILILCPTSVRGVWRREFNKWAPGDFDVLVLEKGSVKQKAEAVEQHSHLCRINHRRCVVVANYESAWRTELAKCFMRHAWGCIVLDESHRIKSPTSKISKFVHRLGKQAYRRLCLTGTPMPHSPLDVFGQYRFLDDRVYGTSWHRFRWNHCFPHPSIQGAHLPNRYKNLGELADKFASIAFQIDASVLDLPPEQHIERAFELSRTHKRLYLDLENEFIAELEDGVVTASNALVKSLRLRQLVSGFLIEDETEKLHIIHDGKASLLRDLLEDLGEPCVVFCEFRYDLDIVRDAAEKLGLRYGELSGRQRDLTPTAEMPEGIDVLGVQYQSGGVGVDLTRVRYGIYYSPTYSLGNYEQSLARIRRPGQERPVTYYHLVCEGTIDKTVYKALIQKREIIDAVLEHLKQGELF